MHVQAKYAITEGPAIIKTRHSYAVSIYVGLVDHFLRRTELNEWRAWATNHLTNTQHGKVGIETELVRIYFSVDIQQG